ncbi:MAG: hypothetical protein H0V18_12520, partial [Pyrinomonadaceae bacterium]|nr:hypothetical protein [Pyrinomonadaceae bacterium]
MKRCPQCNRVEPDDALKFCRVDGVTLVSDSTALSHEPGTAQPGPAPASTEIETSILPHRTDANISRGKAATSVLPPPVETTTGKLRKPKRTRNILVAIAALVVVGVAIALFTSLYLSRRKSTAIQSIAVMPFANESGNADVEYLSDGMTETLINSLSQLPNLSVKARSSVFRYKGKELDPKKIASELNVQAILNGRVMQRGDQLTLSLELIDAQTENVIWSESYNRKQADLVSLQSEIARDVSSKIKTKLSGAEAAKLTKTYTSNPEAYQLYLKGRYHSTKYTEEGFNKGIEYFNQA